MMAMSAGWLSILPVLDDGCDIHFGWLASYADYSTWLAMLDILDG